MSLKYRQGDVDLYKKTKLPNGAKKIGGATLAFGEATGHHHTLFALDEETKIELFEYVDGLVRAKYVEVTGGKVKLRHQEHKLIIVDPGIYEIKIERTYSPFEKMIKKVID